VPRQELGERVPALDRLQPDGVEAREARRRGPQPRGSRLPAERAGYRHLAQVLHRAEAEPRPGGLRGLEVAHDPVDARHLTIELGRLGRAERGARREPEYDHSEAV
jgi:hypothetical protein